MSSLSDEPEHIKRIRATHEKYRKDKVKPLRWRTGPVPRHMEVLYEIPEDYHGVGFGMLNGKIRDHGSVPYTEARWLPLSEILAVVEG